jgi:transmembrane sensor
MERGSLSSAQQRQLSAWVATDVRHNGALIRARAASLHLDRLAALAGGHSVLPPAPSARYITRRGLIAAGVSVAGFVGAGAWLSLGWIDETWGGTKYASGVGQVQKVSLTDGSVMTINTQTQLRVRYTRERRDIRLVRGEAMFSVAHDAARPFAVRVGQWTVLAVGTAFAVRSLDESAMDITVTEGIVDMLPANSGANRVYQRLTANQGANVDGTGRVEVRQLSSSEIARQLAWRAGMVVFTGEPLHRALAEMNRYSSRRIMVADPELAERQIVGVFPTTDIQTFVSGIQATLGLEAVQNGNIVLLRRVN